MLAVPFYDHHIVVFLDQVLRQPPADPAIAADNKMAVEFFDLIFQFLPPGNGSDSSFQIGSTVYGDYRYIIHQRGFTDEIKQFRANLFNCDFS